MKPICCAFLLLVSLAVPLSAQEAIALTTPITTPSIGSYVPARLEIQLQPVPRINVTIIDIATGRTESFGYPCAGVGCTVTTDAQVTALVTALNTANLGTRSLWRRVFDRLILDFASRFVGGATVQ